MPESFRKVASVLRQLWDADVLLSAANVPAATSVGNTKGNAGEVFNRPERLP